MGHLDGTQLISLHLSLYRPFGDKPSSDPHFGPYISILPREFDSHPLTWLVRRQQGHESVHEDFFLRILPKATLSELEKVGERFWGDWTAVTKCLVKWFCPNLGRKISYPYRQKALDEGELQSTGITTREIDFEDYLWGWLIGSIVCTCLFTKAIQSDILPK